MGAQPGPDSTRLRYETLAPEFRVRIGGQDVAPAVQADLIGVAVTQDVDATGTCTVTLQGWDAAKMEVKWIDDDLFAAGGAIEVLMGYRDAVRSLFVGEITGLEPEFGEQRPPTLTVRGHDLRHRLMRTRRTRSFTGMRDSEIADRIATGAGLQASVEDSGAAVPYVLQHDQTDLQFLQERAARLGYEVAIEARTLCFRTRRIDAQPALTLRREMELLAFYPRLTTLGQPGELAAHGWDPGAKQAIDERAAAGDLHALMGGAESGPATGERAFGHGADTVVDLPLDDAADAARLARRRLAEAALRYVRAEGLCIGEPALQAGAVVRVEGLGRRFSGAYYVTRTEHRYRQRSGYRTAFSAMRNAT